MSATDDEEASAARPALADGWARLRALTPARIALGRAGVSLPSAEILRFALAQSRARDAIRHPLDVARLAEDLAPLAGTAITVRSRAADRAQFLVRPDLGRRVHGKDVARLVPCGPVDLVFVLSDGLSPIAVQRHAVPVLAALWPRIAGLGKAPPVIATEARVALADEVGEQLQARIAISLIGERPGLSSPDSLGIYVTYAPRVGATDEQRNCISNIREGALSHAAAAELLAAIVHAGLGARCTGIRLQAALAALPAAEQEPRDRS